MDLYDNIPEEYFDTLMEEFAYDPIKLSCAEDPSQVLYNRRTLETIWDTKHSAINPYTRQPFHIRNVIPQSELKQQMCEYLLKNRSVTLSLGLQVIPDYAQILDETEMKQLLNGLVLAGKRCLCRLQKKKKRQGDRNRNRKPEEKELEDWNALWKKLNLVRLYCQYRKENREAFSSIKGYKSLFQVINILLQYSSHEYSGLPCDDAKEVLKEVVKIVDVMGGLKEKDLLMAPERAVFAFVRILFNLIESRYLKIRSMALRICREMFEDSIYYFVTSKENSIDYMVKLAFHVLRQNPNDIMNEDLYNGMTILNAASCINKVRDFDFPNYVTVLSSVVGICVSRFQELHDAQTISKYSSSSSSNRDDKYAIISSGGVGKNINQISVALEKGLFLVYSFLPLPNSEEEPDSDAFEKEMLRRMDIVEHIVRMVELILAGNKFFRSTHLRFGLKITAALGLSGRRRSEHAQVLRNFLGSKMVDEYGTEVKLLLEEIGLAFPKESFNQALFSLFLRFFDCLTDAFPTDYLTDA